MIVILLAPAKGYYRKYKYAYKTFLKFIGWWQANSLKATHM